MLSFLLYFRKNVRKFEILTMQIAVVVPFVLFVKAVLWTDDQRVLDGVGRLMIRYLYLRMISLLYHEFRG